MNDSMSDFNLKMKYLGYSGVNLERVSLNSFRNISEVVSLLHNNPNYTNISNIVKSLPSVSLEEIRALAKQFYDKYFSLNDISILTLDKISENIDYLSTAISAEDGYKKINQLLTQINPLDIDIKFVEGHALFGKIQKPIIILPTAETSPNRRVYYSHIELGNEANILSASTLVHEIAHAEQEQNFGFASDYLDKEIISVFLEKACSLELDSTGELLKIFERVRLLDLVKNYADLYRNKGKITTTDHIKNLLYIKSTFYAIKLFDMYLNERKQKNRDKYFYEIQDVFDGKITVEDIIRNREITPAKTQDLTLLKRHI